MRQYNSDGPQQFGRNPLFRDQRREAPALPANFGFLNAQLANLPFHADHNVDHHQGHQMKQTNLVFKILLLLVLFVILNLITSENCPAS